MTKYLHTMVRVSSLDDSIAFFKSYGIGVGFIGADEVQAY